MAIFNYTGRKAIPRNTIVITAAKDVPCLVIYLQNAIAEASEYAECLVILEAYLHTKIQRVELGLAKNLPKKAEARFSEFLSGEGVLFRIKLVEPATKKIRAVGERFSIAKKANQPVVHDSTGKRRSPISVRWAEDDDDMGGRFWKVRLSKNSSPTLLLQRGKITSIQEVNSPVFTALVKPAILKEVLTYAFLNNCDDFPEWSKDWLELSTKVLGVGDDAPTEEPEDNSLENLKDYRERTEEWIDHVVSAFAKKCGLQGISSDFKRS